jgi:hypothetical protein
MSAPDNRRTHERLPVRLAVHFARGDKKFVLQSANLSLGGVFLKDADDVCAEGDDLQLDIIVPAANGDPELHALRGTVVQVIPDVGAGLRFDWHQSMTSARDALIRFIERVGMDNTPLVHTEGVGLSTDAEEER